MSQFIPGLSHPEVASAQAWLLVSGDQVYCPRGQLLHQRDALTGLTPGATVALKIGQLQRPGAGGIDCHCLLLPAVPQSPDAGWYGLRALLDELPEPEFRLAGAAVSLGHWLADHRFCGRCAGATRMLDTERALQCQRCGHLHYPRLSPCVIGLVTRGDQCLLAVHRRAKTPFYTALAGFIEAGESVEAAVLREVREEVGLEVGNCRYLGSQPWPFPGQLMLGFLADYQGGDICLQDDELLEAGWFRFDALPELVPPATSLSGQLIRHFVQLHAASRRAT